MKTYIGIKAVQAEPERIGEEDGYHVIYADGYRSWSPKAVFEEAYTEVKEGFDSGFVLKSLVDRLKRMVGVKNSNPLRAGDNVQSTGI